MWTRTCLARPCASIGNSQGPLFIIVKYLAPLDFSVVAPGKVETQDACIRELRRSKRLRSRSTTSTTHPGRFSLPQVKLWRVSQTIALEAHRTGHYTAGCNTWVIRTSDGHCCQGALYEAYPSEGSRDSSCTALHCKLRA